MKVNARCGGAARGAWVGVLGAVLGGCSSFAYTDERLEHKGDPAPASRATFDVTPRGNPRVMVLLSISGGGSRAAYFGGAVMLELERACADVNLLHEVDAISSVSGGSLPAAYYCITRDEDDPKDAAASNREWSEKKVRTLMGRNYLARLFGNLLWPSNIVLYYGTAYDRADIMAQTFADNLFDDAHGGRDLNLGELNPERPCLILNSTDATQNRQPLIARDGTVQQPGEQHYGNVFTFTTQDFTDKLGADINQYSVARAVMSTACFPSVFPYMTLRDWRELRGPEPRYVHVFDGGNSDNLGLVSLERLLHETESWPPERRPERYVILCVDAYTQPRGVDRDKADPRTWSDLVVDHNFLDAIDALLAQSRFNVLSRFLADKDEQDSLRAQQLEDAPMQQMAPEATQEQAQQVKDWVQSQEGNLPTDLAPPPAPAPTVPQLTAGWQPRELPNLTFWHIEFRDVKDRDLRARLYKIPTSFKLPGGAAEDLDAAAHQLIAENTKHLDQVRAALGLPAMEP